jgi:hypothetical protein
MIKEPKLSNFKIGRPNLQNDKNRETKKLQLSLILPPSDIISKKDHFFLFQIVSKSNSFSSFSRFAFTYSHKI